MKSNLIYLDNAATTALHPEVLHSMWPYLTGSYGNPGALYSFGDESRKAVDNAREQVAKFIGAHPDQIIFTSGGTESNNSVFNYFANIGTETGKRIAVTSTIEHDSVLRPLEFYSKKNEIVKSFCKVDSNGVADIDCLKGLISSGVGLISLMYVNNEIGSVNPVEEISELCKENGILFHSDCVQAAGCMNINVERMGCDFISLSSHKINGPKGVGALYVRDRLKFIPMIYGGKSQEFGLRGGTENVAGIVGFGKACERIGSGDSVGKYITELKKRFWEILRDLLDGITTVTDNASSASSNGKVLNVRINGVDAESLVTLLGVRGVCISSGSACTAREQKPSHVLTGIGLKDSEARESVRISFSMDQSFEDIELAANIIAESVDFLLRVK